VPKLPESTFFFETEEFPMHTYKAAPDVDVVSSTAEIPGFGKLAINAFVIHAEEPVLVDTGAVREGDDFMAALRTVIDPSDLRWIWLTHTDFDHIGSLRRLLEENERLRVVTTFLGVGIMGLTGEPLPMDRVYLANPGQAVDVGDRTLTAVKPPAFDNPITVGLRDDRSGILFSSDCFGALLDEVPECAEDLSDEALHQGQVFWATVDSSWLHKVDRAVFASDLDRIRALEPTMVLSSHLPPARGSSTERLLGALAAVPAAPAFVGPDQAALEQMLAGMAGATA
jgi:flavorubredoxin